MRGRYAQHSFLAHMDFRIGAGLAGVHDTGNVMEDVHFGGTLFIAARTSLYSVRTKHAGR